MTPLIRADRLGDELGFTAPLWVKDDSANPTHSFKDRVVSVAVTAARELGFERIACASTGNLGNSVAAHAARIGMPSIVFVPADLEAPKIVQSAIYGGTLVGIEGSYDDVNRLCSELSETDEFEKTGFVNVNVRPYYAEGSKTLGYEVAEQLGWRLPGQYLAPMASGSMLTKIHKAFKELAAIGLVPSASWKVFGAQSAGCSPIATAFGSGTDEVIPVRPTGIAKSLNIGNPADGRYALDAVRSTGGAMAAVDDEEIREGIRLAGPHDGRVRRDRRRRHDGGVEEARRVRRHRHVRRDGHLQHRRRTQDDRRRERERRPDRNHPADAEGHARRRPPVKPTSTP